MKYILVLILAVAVTSIKAQVIMNKDSLLKLLPVIKEDSAGAEFYINLGQQYEGSEPEVAKDYYRKVKSISEKINYKRGIIKYIFNYTYVLNVQGYFDSGLVLNLQSVDLARNFGDSLLLCKALINTGTSYRLLTQYENAVRYFEEGKKIALYQNDIRFSAKLFDILQLLYFDLENYSEAIRYGEQSVTYMRKLNDSLGLGTALVNLGLAYTQSGDQKNAVALWNESLRISKEIGNTVMEASILLNLGDLYLNTGDYRSLYAYYNKAFELYTKLEGYEGKAIALRGISYYYFFQKDFEKAKVFGEQSLDIINKNNLFLQKKKTLELLSSVYFALQDVVKGHQYQQEATIISDSILNDKVRKNTMEVEKKYESEKKDAKIKLQQADLKSKSILNYILIGSAISLLIISLLGYRNYKHKQNLQQQRIVELETQQQLAATEAVLKGEEQERTRLAKDLHDGLGGMLSGIKHSFQNMKGNLILTLDNALAFERSMDMLDSSIKEMRRVAHNMMPETLVKYGLDTAVKDFCNDINQSGAVKVIYQSVGMEGVEIEQTASITIYRIVQELVNNIIKHAAATQAVVQINKINEQISITVEDDGKGFNTEVLKTSKGIGWSNIKNRIEFLNGKLDVQSEKEKGTSVHIEMNV